MSPLLSIVFDGRLVLSLQIKSINLSNIHMRKLVEWLEQIETTPCVKLSLICVWSLCPKPYYFFKDDYDSFCLKQVLNMAEHKVPSSRFLEKLICP